MADLFSGASAQSTPSVFNFGAHAVRIVVRNGEPWFVAADVAEALGYRNAPDAARNLGEHQKASTQIVRSTSGGNPNVTIINESGLYRLVLRSRKPAAEQFSDWVTGEVLPSIRKSGRYEKPDPEAAQQRKPNRSQVVLTDNEAFNLYGLLNAMEHRLSPARLGRLEKALDALGSFWAGEVHDLQGDLRAKALHMAALKARCASVMGRVGGAPRVRLP